MNYQSVITLNTKSKTKLTWWRVNLRICNGRTFSQLNPQVIVQTDASLTGWGAVCSGVQTSGHCSEEERTLHINVLELLVIKLALFFFTKGKMMKAIHFQIDNKAALSYLLKWGNKEQAYDQTEQRDLALPSKSQYGYHCRIPAFSTGYSSRHRIKKNIRLFRLASSSRFLDY